MTTARILVVEDDRIVAESIENMLRRLDYSVPSIASTGEEAIQQAAKAEPDLVLMDIGLPGRMDGVEAAQSIRARFDIPVVYLTAYADDQTLQRAEITEPFGYIVKPFQIRELHGTIKLALYKHEVDRRLKESETRYRAISELISDFAYSFRVEPDGTMAPEWETGAFSRMVGRTLEEAITRGGWEGLVYPDDLALVHEHQQTYLSGQPHVSEYRIITTSGEVRWVRDYGQPVRDETQARVVRIYGAARDITERVQAQETLHRKANDQAALYEGSQVFLDQFDVETTLENTCRLAVERFKLEKAWIGLVAKDGFDVHPVATYGLDEDDLNSILETGDDSPTGQGATGAAIRTAQPVAVNHIDTDPDYAPWRLAALEQNYRSSAALPLCYGDEVLGALNVYSAEPDHFSEDRLQVLQSFANLTAVALQKARFHEQIQRHAAELEQRVTERTAELRETNAQLETEIAERKRAEKALRESEERFRTVADFTYDWEYWIDADGNYIYVSPSCERITGYRADEFHSEPGLLETITHPDDRAKVTQHFEYELNGHKAVSFEFRIIARNGEVHWIDHLCQPVYGTDGHWLGQRASNRDITDRKQAEETLRQYERIVSATPDLMALLDKDYVYQAVNDTYLKAYNKDRNQIIGHTVAELLGSDVFEEMLKGYLDRCLEGIATHYQAWLEFPGRGRRFMSVTYHPYFDAQHTVSGIVVSSRDITDLKRAEEALRRSEAKHRAIFAASPDYVYLTDVEGRFLDANPAFLNWTGLALEELQQRFFMHFFAGDSFDELQAYVEKMGKGQEIKTLEMRVKNTRGEILETEINAVPLKENGEVTAVLNLARDVTERVRVESQRDATLEALQVSEEKYRALFEASTDAIFLETLDGRVLDCNATACNTYGYTQEELVGLTVADLVPEEVARTLPGIITEEVTTGGVFVEATGKRKDGSAFPAQFSTRLATVGGRQLVIAYVRDITAQVQAEATLKETRDQLEVALRKRS